MSQEKSALHQPLNQSIKESIEPVSREGINPNRVSVNEVISESMLSVDDDWMKKKKRKFKIIIGCGCCWMLVGLLLFLLLPSLIHTAIVNTAINSAILSPDNQKFWESFPGESGTVITRNYSFFNFTNEEEVLLHGEKPKFREIQGYIVTELEQFLNITYNEDQTKVSMKDWLHFGDNEDSRNLNEKVKIMNIGPIGFWYTLKNSRDTLILLEGLSLLFSNIEASIINQVVGQGVSSQYLSTWDAAYSQLYSPAGLSQENSMFLWEDVAYGMSDKNNLQFWVDAAQSSFKDGKLTFSMTALFLKDYFTLTDSQVISLLSEMLTYSNSIYNLIITNHYCAGIQKCDGRQLAIRQMASSYVTWNTPPVSSITPTDTICTDNVTCNGRYPQISSYFENVYKKKHPEVDPLLKFDVEIVRKWLDYNPERIEKEYNKAQSALLHIGNLDALWANGTSYDEAKTDEDKAFYLSNIKQRFGLPSDIHTKVFWEWIKYITHDFIRLGTEGNQRVGIGSTFAEGFYDSFSYLQDHLQSFLLKQMIKINLSDHQCVNFIETSFQTNDKDLASTICNHYSHNLQSDQFIFDMIGACRNKFHSQWQNFIDMGVTSVQIESLCDQDIKQGFGSYYHLNRVIINDFYHCDQTPSEYCSDYELALKQWANSTVTMNLPVAMSLKTTTTFSEWDSQAKKVEYGHYVSKFPDKQFPVFKMDYSYKMMNFENWFSATVIMKVFGSASQQIKDYIRYVTIFVGLGGFTQVRSAKDLIFGYDDKFLTQRKDTYPPFGGDPSIQNNIAFNDRNISKDEAVLELEWHTGKDNYSLLGQHSLINGKNYLTVNYSKFNGNQTYFQLQSPWIGNDHFYGTSGKQFAPDQATVKNVSIYVPNLQRFGSGDVNALQDVNRYGYDLKMGSLGRSIYVATNQSDLNKKYYQTYYAVFNETSVVGFPFFFTKHHFMNCTDNWTTFVDIYNEDQTILYKNTSHWDDCFVIVEPYSGVSFQSTLYLQANYLYEPDDLYTYNQTSFLPVFSIYRAGNLTEEQANNLFGEMKVAFVFQGVMFYVGIFVAIGGAIGSGVGFHSLRKLQQQKKDSFEEQQNENKKTKLKISLQKMEAQKKKEEQERRPMIKDNQPQEEELEVPKEQENQEKQQKKAEVQKPQQEKKEQNEEQKKQEQEEKKESEFQELHEEEKKQ